MHTSALFGYNSKFWYRISLFNLLLLASVGFLLRYKHFASLPWMHYKNFLHGHSHFAFAGWISLALMAAFAKILGDSNCKKIKQVQALLWLQWIVALGMLISFSMQGYAPLSITFSTASILLSYAFTYLMWGQIDTIYWGKASALSLKAALVFNVLSSAGAFCLAGLMASHATVQSYYFAALYFFLHFQYNGWFFFGITALLLQYLHINRWSKAQESTLTKSLWWFIVACVPAVLLSSLWMQVPWWVYGLAVVAAVFQWVGCIYGIAGVRKALQIHWAKLPSGTRYLWILSFVAFILRLSLQVLSTVPALGKFAFAYRPVVIGYLHLILIGSISFFILGWYILQALWVKPAYFKAGIILFVTGFLGTEITLMLQGFGYIGWVSIPHISSSLLICAMTMWLGAALLWLGALGYSKSTNTQH